MNTGENKNKAPALSLQELQTQPGMAWINDIQQQTAELAKNNPAAARIEQVNLAQNQSNPKHTAGMEGNRANAGIEPSNSLDLFGNSLPSPARPDNVRYTVDSEGQIHRFFIGNGVWHWSGSTADPKNPVASTEIPISIRRLPGVSRDIRNAR